MMESGYLDKMLTIAIENDLFETQPQKEIQNSILTKLKEVRQIIEKKTDTFDYPYCHYELSKAAELYFKAVKSARLSWRLLNIYAVHVWVYLITFLCLVFIFYYYFLQPNNSFFIFLNTYQTGIDAVVWGIIGGLLRGLWWLWKNVDKRQYRKTWIIWFISTPFLGGILGAISYFLIFAGLSALSESNNENETPNTFLVLAISTLAGFNWEWIVDQLNRIKERF